MSAGLVLRISVVNPLPDAVIAAGMRDADIPLRDQQVAPEQVRHEVPVDDDAEAQRWLTRNAGRLSEVSGRLRFALVAGGATS